jgi:hypothetical protein
MPSSDNQTIHTDCYNGFDGLTIRIDTVSHMALAMIQQVFRDLAEGTITEIEFLNLEGVTAENIQSVKLRLVEKDPAYKAIQKTSDEPKFCWSRSKEGWEDCVWLVDGILNSDSASGHQYFDQTLGDDAVIVIAHGEGG